MYFFVVDFLFVGGGYLILILLVFNEEVKCFVRFRSRLVYVFCGWIWN